MIPLNYYQYRLDLNKANENTAGPLIWDNVFNFLEEYGAKSMRPEDLDGYNDFVSKMSLNECSRMLS
jgi:hypothetical protein